MGKKSSGKKASHGGREHPTDGQARAAPVSWILIGLALAVAIAGVYFVLHRHDPQSTGTESTSGGRTLSAIPGKHSFQPLVGRWVRPDGGYIISVRSVGPDGRVDAGYFNPRPINVSRAEASVQGKAVKLFIELQAAGYPGSTYELIHDPGNDVLVGVYFQAAMQQRFDVVFVRTE